MTCTLRIAAVVCVVGAIGSGLAQGKSPDEQAVLETTVIDYAPEQRIVGLAVGWQGGVAIGDRFWVFDSSGAIGAGMVFFASPQKAAGRFEKPLAAVPVGSPAVILRESMLPSLCEQLPFGVTIRGRIERVPPGHHSAWLRASETVGLRAADQMLVTRSGIPIARGRVAILEPDAVLVTLEPLVGNAVAETGDAIEVWPAPADARWGRLNSTVLQVEEAESEEGALLSLAGSAEDGLTVGRLVDVSRGRLFVGVAAIVQVSSPLSKARMIRAATANEPREGDSAVVRPLPGERPAPLVVPVFRVEQGYCLIAAGETDGVVVGEKFIIRRTDPADPLIRREVAELTVQAVKVDYAGANIRPLQASGGDIKVWDMAERRVAAGEWCQTIGIVEGADREARIAAGSVGPTVRLSAGRVIRWVPEADVAPGGGVVLRLEDGRLVFWVPPGWGRVEDLPRARIEAVQAVLATGSPAAPASGSP